MQRPLKLIIMIFILCINFYTPFLTFAQISYYLEINEQTWDSFHIQITIENLQQPFIIFSMPEWRPGDYTPKNFSQSIKNFEAYDETAQQLHITQLNTNSWTIRTNKLSYVTVEYDVDHSRDNALSYTFAMIDGASNLMYINGKKQLAAKINFRVPHGWKLATGLPTGMSSFEYIASSYEHLIDCPFYMGKFNEYYFTLENHPFYVIVDGIQNFDINKLLVNMKKISSYNINIFNDIPFDKYFFILQLTSSDQIISSEHQNSTYISIPQKLMRTDTQKVLNIITQNFFHLWNGIRIYPENYITTNRTKCLWFIEGLTDYYTALTMIRTNIWSEHQFLNHISELIETLQENPLNQEISIEQASLNYNENNKNLIKNKGQLIALLLDLSIREFTKNKNSLDDVIEFMYRWFAKEGKGYAENDILRAINAITFHDFTLFYNRYIKGTLELPFHKTLNYAGITIQATKDTLADVGYLRLIKPQNKIFFLEKDGPLVKAGLKEGDFLHSVNGKRIKDVRHLTEIVDQAEPGSDIRVLVERDGIQLVLHTTTNSKENFNIQLKYVPESSEIQTKIRQSWMEDRIEIKQE